MASPRIEVYTGLSGLSSPTMEIYPEGSDTTIATGLTLTEETNRKGVYTTGVSALTSLVTSPGYYYVQVFASASLQWQGWVYLLDVTTWFYATDTYAPPHERSLMGSVVTNGANTSLTFEVSLGQTVPSLSGGMLFFITGALAGEFQQLGAPMIGSPPFVTLSSAFSTAPSGGDLFVMLPAALMVGTSGASTHTAADVKTAMEAASGHLDEIKNVTDAIPFSGGGDIEATLDGEEVDVGSIKGTAGLSEALAANLGKMIEGEVSAQLTSTSIRLVSGDMISGHTDHWTDRRILWIDGVCAGSTQLITGSSESAGFCTLVVDKAWPGVGPSAGDLFRLI